MQDIYIFKIMHFQLISSFSFLFFFSHVLCSLLTLLVLLVHTVVHHYNVGQFDGNGFIHVRTLRGLPTDSLSPIYKTNKISSQQIMENLKP